MEGDLRGGCELCLLPPRDAGGRGMGCLETYGVDTREQMAHSSLNAPSCQQIKWEVAGDGDWD